MAGAQTMSWYSPLVAKNAWASEWLPMFVVIPVIVAMRRFLGWEFALAALVFAVVAMVGVNLWLGRRRSRRELARVSELAALSTSEREAELAKVDPNDAALARLALDEVLPAHQDPRAQTPRVFSYPGFPAFLHRMTFYLCAAFALLPTVLLLTGNVQRSQRGNAFLVALTFSAFAMLSLFLMRLKAEEIRIGASGLVRTNTFGRRNVVPWSAIHHLEWGRFQTLRIVGHRDQLLLKVSPALRDYNQFIEALMAESERLRPTTGIGDENNIRDDVSDTDATNDNDIGDDDPGAPPTHA